MRAIDVSAESSAELLQHVLTVLVRDHLQVHGEIGDLMADKLFRALRRRFGGQELYIPVEDGAAERRARIVALFDGRNHDHVCRVVGVSRATLYRTLQAMRTQKQSHPAPKHETNAAAF